MSYHHPMPGAPGARSEAPNVEVLKDLCKEELAASHTYERALSLPALARHFDVLERCYASHHNRVAELRERITSLGSEPPTAPGVWGSLIPTLATAAAALGEKLAISLLDESEERSTRRYHERLDGLDAADRVFLIERIIPAQEASRAAVSEVKNALSA